LDATENLMRFFGECRRAVSSSGTGTLPDRDRLPSTLGPNAGSCLVDGIGGSWNLRFQAQGNNAEHRLEAL